MPQVDYDPWQRMDERREPLTPSVVESEILRLCGLLERASDALAIAAETKAKADVRFTMAHARAIGMADGRSAEQRQAQAMLACEDEYAVLRAADAALVAAKAIGHDIRAQLDSLRSINANVRQQAGLR